MGSDMAATAMVSPATHWSVRVPSVARCGLVLAIVKLALNTAGFGRTYRWIRRHAECQSLVENVSAEVITAAEHAVAMAAALYPGRALCLEQSLVLYYLLRRQGVPVVFRMGVQPHPFAAHAWIECRGQPINDIPEHVKHFTPLSSDLS